MSFCAGNEKKLLCINSLPPTPPPQVAPGRHPVAPKHWVEQALFSPLIRNVIYIARRTHRKTQEAARVVSPLRLLFAVGPCSLWEDVEILPQCDSSFPPFGETFHWRGVQCLLHIGLLNLPQRCKLVASNQCVDLDKLDPITEPGEGKKQKQKQRQETEKVLESDQPSFFT